MGLSEISQTCAKTASVLKDSAAGFVVSADAAAAEGVLGLVFEMTVALARGAGACSFRGSIASGAAIDRQRDQRVTQEKVAFVLTVSGQGQRGDERRLLGA